MIKRKFMKTKTAMEIRVAKMGVKQIARAEDKATNEIRARGKSFEAIVREHNTLGDLKKTYKKW